VSIFFRLPMEPLTPLLLSREISQHAGKPVHLKLENLRPSGSYKDRGMTTLLQDMANRGITTVVSSSGGNAGLAVAVCGQKLGLRVTVVVPTTTKALMVDKIRTAGAEVVVHGADWNAADAFARELVERDGCGYAHPFDDPLLWVGHGSLVKELRTQLGDAKPGCVVVAVGGGGLLCGVLEGLQKVGWENVPVVACETEGAASFAAALLNGSPVTLPAITSIATSLGARRVCDASVSRALAHPGGVTSWVTNDRTAVRALVRFLRDHRLLVEPACACALAAVYEGAPCLSAFGSICVVVCGGSSVDLGLVNAWRTQLGADDP